MTASLETLLIDRLTAGLPRSRSQLNRPHESDAELVRLPDGSVLAVTTDGVVEEIETGLYADPYLAGWMAVAVNASDLAAVGASPLGIVVCETLPRGAEESLLAAVQRGLAESAAAHALPVLGGDTNEGARMQLVGTALGLIEGGAPLTRVGARPGERVYATGPLGLGSAFAFARMQRTGGEPPFRPLARLKAGQALRGVASACMDTSDGAIATLDELGRLNGVGFRLTTDVRTLLHPAALALAREAQLPPWFLLAGPHGEFELLFTVAEGREEALRSASASAGFTPLLLGEVIGGSGIELTDGRGPLQLDGGKVRNLFEESGGEIGRYVAALTAMDRAEGR